MKKQIRITLADGRVYGVDAHKVADDRARDYSESDPEISYNSEYDYMMNNDSELEDWLFNNMNWYDLDPVLIQHFLEPLCDCEINETEVKRIL